MLRWILLFAACSHALPADPLPDSLCQLVEQECQQLVTCGQISRSAYSECVRSTTRGTDEVLAKGGVTVDDAAVEACARSVTTCPALESPADACLLFWVPQAGGCAADCDRFCLSGVCRARGGENEVCTDGLFSSDCQEGLFCRYGACVRPGASGQRCLSAPPGWVGPFSPQCDGDSWCDQAADLCRPRLAAGAACTVADSCVAGNDCVSGICRPYADIGEACDGAGPASGCARDAFCNADSVCAR